MPVMDLAFSELEKFYQHIEPDIVNATSLGKVLRHIVELKRVPRDEDFHFVERGRVVLAAWSKNA